MIDKDEIKSKLQKHRISRIHTKNQTDLRYIPELSNYKKIRYEINSKDHTEYGDRLSEALWGTKISSYSNSLLFGTPKDNPKLSSKSPLNSVPITIKKTFEKVQLIDNFYLSPMHWSKNGLIYVGLDSALYSYKPSSQCWNKIKNELDMDDAYISATCASSTKIVYSISFLGDKKPNLYLIDAATGNNISGCYLKSRLSIIRCDNDNQNVFYMGSFNQGFGRWDIRESSYSYYSNLKKEQEICGMSLSGEVIATGDNGNRIRLWDFRNLKAPFFSTKSHTAAVKALAFSPFNHSILASAGGLADQTLRLWDIKKLEQISIESTEKQTCNLHWIDKNTLFSTHGRDMGNIKDDAKMHVWKIKNDNELKLAGSGVSEVYPKFFSTQNPNNLSMSFTASVQKGAELVQVGHEKKEESVFSLKNKRNMIR